MTILKEEKKLVREADITWKDFVNYYKNTKIKKACYRPFALASAKHWLEMYNAVIVIDSGGDLEIKNSGASFTLASDIIESIKEGNFGNNRYIQILTKQKEYMKLEW